MKYIHQLVIAVLAAAHFAASSASAAPTASDTLKTFTATWSGAPYGNTATATATIVIDESLFSNPGINESGIGAGTFINSITMTVSGANTGNGTFHTADFSKALIYIPLDALNLDVQWVGQAQPSFGSTATWGPNDAVGDFDFFSSTGAPTYGTACILRTSSGEIMALTSVLPAVGLTLRAGAAVTNVTGATIASIHPPSIADDESYYLAGTITGKGITAANNACILQGGVSVEVATAVVQGGALLNGAAIKSFGDPNWNPGGSNLLFQATLAVSGTVTTLNDKVLASVNPDGTHLAQLAVLGQNDATGLGFHFTKFSWFHGVAGGVFFGATTADNTTPKPHTGQGVYFSNGSTITPLAVAGGAVTIDGESHTIKAVSLPTVTAPAQAETRVGNATYVALLITTTDHVTAIVTYSAPASAPSGL